jgi:hypothetical protein
VLVAQADGTIRVMTAESVTRNLWIARFAQGPSRFFAYVVASTLSMRDTPAISWIKAAQRILNFHTMPGRNQAR